METSPRGRRGLRFASSRVGRGTTWRGWRNGWRVLQVRGVGNVHIKTRLARGATAGSRGAVSRLAITDGNNRTEAALLSGPTRNDASHFHPHIDPLPTLTARHRQPSRHLRHAGFLVAYVQRREELRDRGKTRRRGGILHRVLAPRRARVERREGGYVSSCRESAATRVEETRVRFQFGVGASAPKSRRFRVERASNVVASAR
mmetsp:Transcript_6161/g.23294  ORF Transcript_6161/g.23294 Transcript_6161/m.23294 type:complete len:203 (+) Transcript_6161:211-819(+)